jgi:hypothetical protein
LLILGAAALIVVLLTLLKIYDPVHTGAWVGPHLTLIGVIDDPQTGHDLLGLWLFPCAAVVLMLVWIVGRLLLSIAVPLLAAAPSTHRTGIRS